MTDAGGGDLRQRVLLLAPTEKDAALTRSILERAGVECVRCANLAELCEQLGAGAGAVVLPEEAVAPVGGNLLGQWLSRQPQWSDLPVLVLARPGADSAAVAEAMDLLGNVTVLERPMRISALVSAVRASLRARQRQYQIREQMAERERAAEVLRQRIEEMQTLMDTLPIGVFIAHDPECRRITGNRAAAEMLRSQTEKNLSMTAPPDERPQHFRVCRDGVEIPPKDLPVQRASKGEQIRDEPLDQVFEDGTVIRTLVSASPVYGPTGELRGAVAAILDVTRQKRFEEALQQADRRKDEFLAILAHELRNPLAPIRNSLHILRQTSKDDPAAERVGDMLERQVNTMVRLVDDLLEVSRITRGKIELRREPVEMSAIVNNAVETSRPLIESAGHRLTLELPPEALVLDGDAVRLTQVFANLLNNAAKYTDAGGQIWLTVRRDGEWVSVSVRDTGRGISAEMLPRVFDLFTQIDRSAERAQGGLGIGLTLVKNLVEMHGGSVEALSDGAGGGTEFVVRLPLASPDRRAGAATVVSKPAAGLTPRRVLVVDDNSDAADSLAMVLKLLGADIRVVYSGSDALAALPTYKPSVVLLDLGMPGMSGYEVARQIRLQPDFEDVILIALTGWGQEEDRRRSRSAGFDYHLIKPADVHSLQSLLISLEESAAAQKH